MSNYLYKREPVDCRVQGQKPTQNAETENCRGEERNQHRSIIVF